MPGINTAVMGEDFFQQSSRARAQLAQRRRVAQDFPTLALGEALLGDYIGQGVKKHEIKWKMEKEKWKKKKSEV